MTGATALNEILTGALSYAAQGIPVFPCDPRDKKPLTPHGFKDASCDRDMIAAWWRTWPNAMVGIPTGEVSGCFVLDVDQDEAKGIDGEASLEALLDQEGRLPETALQITPRGGRHFFFRHPGIKVPNSASKLGSGLDIRGDGGYVVIAPSINAAGKAYRWQRDQAVIGFADAPVWLLRLVAPTTKAQDDAKVYDINLSAGRSKYLDIAVTGEARKVAGAVSGQRNNALNSAAFSLGQFVGSGALDRAMVEQVLFDAATHVGLVADDGDATVRKTLNSGLEAGIKQPREVPEPKARQKREPAQRRAAREAAPEDAIDSDRSVIRIAGGALPQIVDQAEDALISSKCALYQRGSMIVRPALAKIAVSHNRETLAPRLVPVKSHHIVEIMTTVADWERFDGRSEEWVPTDCPVKVAETYLAREGLWKLPFLTGVINAPTLRPDGSLLETAGYDEATGLLYDPQGATFAPLVQEPTQEQARAALDTLKKLIETFTFLTDADRSVALSAILTAVIRRSIPTAPLHGFTAPTAGSGKSLLVDIAAMIATGRLAAVVSQGKTEEEMEKRLGSALIAGDGLISIDNCEAPLGGELLCQTLTQQALKIRILGKSLNAEVPSNASLFATGNNLVLIGDMTRRALLCSLDPGVERPELREFNTDPIAAIQEDRNLYVRAALTILRAFHVAGRPQQKPPLGSFGQWSRWVRDALIWLGETDPCDTMEKVRAADPKLEALITVLQQWKTVIGGDRVSVKEVIDRAAMQSPTSGMFGRPEYSRAEFNHPEFREALLVVAGEGGAINSKRLGKWLGAHDGRIADGMKIQFDGISGGNRQWRLVSNTTC